MLYVRISARRIWIISEYWIFIPAILLIEFAIIGKFKQKQSQKQAQKNEEQELTELKKDFAR